MAANSQNTPTTGNGPPTGNWAELPEQIIPARFRPWPEKGFSALRQIARGAILGGIAGCTSLMLNVIGSVAWVAANGSEQHPLHLIRVYLTFPLGESALRLDSGLVLAFGCILYLVTGMLYGVLFETATTYVFPHAQWLARLLLFTLMSLVLWAVNFYGILIWLQPLTSGGRWIVELIPWWVAAGTHLVFGGTMGLIYPSDALVASRIPV